jgi:hypothetical protein
MDFYRKGAIPRGSYERSRLLLYRHSRSRLYRSVRNRCPVCRLNDNIRGELSWRAITSGPRRILAQRPVTLIPPRLEVRVGPLREEDAPRDLELGARGAEARRCAAGAFAGPAAGIEAASPPPALVSRCGRRT